MKQAANGIKVSSELAQIDVRHHPAVSAAIEAYLLALAERRINLPFLTLSGPGADTAASLCVAAADRGPAERAAQEQSGLWTHLTVVAPVAAVSVFPHRSSAVLLHSILGAYAREGLPVLALGSSISAFTFTMGLGHIERALEVLDETLELPPNHAPLHAELVVRQLPE